MILCTRNRQELYVCMYVCMYVCIYIYIVGRPLRANGKVDPKGPCSGYVKNALAFGSDPYSDS